MRIMSHNSQACILMSSQDVNHTLFFILSGIGFGPWDIAHDMNIA